MFHWCITVRLVPFGLKRPDGGRSAHKHGYDPAAVRDVPAACQQRTAVRNTAGAETGVTIFRKNAQRWGTVHSIRSPIASLLVVDQPTLLPVFQRLLFLLFVVITTAAAAQPVGKPAEGYRGIWYFIGPTKNEYAYKYSGGLGTYPANHYPFSVYAPAVNKTFFCYGGVTDSTSRELCHMVGVFDHKTGMVSRPTLLLNKQTDDAHDNPVIQVDDQGYVWIFSTSHGTERPSFIHKSREPYRIDAFDRIDATRLDKDGKTVPFNNFSYLQVYRQQGQAF